MTSTGRALSVLGVLVLGAWLATTAVGDRAVLTGNDEAAWLFRVRKDNQGQTVTDILTMPAGRDWQWVTKESPRPWDTAAAVSVGERASVFLAPVGYWMIDEEGRTYLGVLPEDVRWPAGRSDAVVALASMRGLSPAGREEAVAIVRTDNPLGTPPRVVPGHENKTTTKPTTAPAGRSLVAFRDTGNGWDPLAIVAKNVLPSASDGRDSFHVFAASDRDGLYVLLARQGGNRLYWCSRPGGRRTRRPRTRPAEPAIVAPDDAPAPTEPSTPYLLPGREVPLPRSLAGAQIHGLVTNRTGLFLVARLGAGRTGSATQPASASRPTSTPASGPASRPTSRRTWEGLSLVRLDSTTGRIEKRVPLTADGETSPFDKATDLQVARVGQRVALLWREDKTWRFATAGTDGRVAGETKLGILHDTPEPAYGEEIFQYFMWGVLIAFCFALLVLRNPEPGQPFVFPPVLRPGGLLKRLLAAGIDFLPAAVLTSLILGVGPQQVPSLLNMFASDSLGDTVLYWWMGTLVIYVTYGAVLEWRYAATLGKRLMKLRVIGSQGRPPGLREALLRNIMKIFEFLVPPRIPPLLLLWPIINRNRMRLGDYIARSAVVDATYFGQLGPEGLNDEQLRQSTGLGPDRPADSEDDSNDWDA